MRVRGWEVGRFRVEGSGVLRFKGPGVMRFRVQGSEVQVQRLRIQGLKEQRFRGQRRCWSPASSQVENEIFGARFGNQPMLGFASLY
jgi:hypothetical protein